ncbi:DHA1 family inner membrane transport protein [Paenarthrobacter ilicis]|uniref:DHA1 family inner membrane transport protein n=1 Tax=Paenarthrobacter ilicis TaxID=43665 RepID=A0ABX0TL33_9MICC|nr:DHA1 family inner membrane transport protein [Paenarthrobacter ilicis]NIJ01397.1 DHA1 family inner membrane transport protein [Paenarthrobacter ilicis]
MTRLPLGLLALAVGGFGIGLTEFVILGLLPEVAADFSVSIPVAGHLVSGYALSVAVGGVVVTAATAALRPKTVLCALMVLFILGNLLSAVAGDYATMFAGRIVAALCHGAFFGIGAVLASNLVTPDRKARAISIMFAGLTIANVIGVPLGTFLGQQFGWRSTFWAITIVGVIALTGLIAYIPAQDAVERGPGQLRRELGAFASGQVWLSILVTVFGFGAMFGAFTYIAPMLTSLAGMPASAVPWMLVIFGAGLFTGNILGGKAADGNLDKSLLILLSALTFVLLVFTVTVHNPWGAAVTLFLLGAVGFAAVPGMQTRVLSFAHRAPTLASGVNISAFNLGNAIGAHLGGTTIAAGFGLASPIWVGAGLAIIAVALIASASLALQRTKTPPAGTPETAPSPALTRKVLS